MTIAAIFAGGVGSRMGEQAGPKQFLPLAGVPIIARTAKKFYDMSDIDSVIVLSPKDWLQETEALLARHMGDTSKLHVIAGGADRTGTLKELLNYIKANIEVDENTVLLTHDAVRPLLDKRIILENIEAAREHGACGTYIPAVDTIAQSVDGKILTSVPPRDQMFLTQTPQSFNFKELVRHFSALTDQEKSALTDVCSVFSISGRAVFMVRGIPANIKITYPEELVLAESLLALSLEETK